MGEAAWRAARSEIWTDTPDPRLHGRKDPVLALTLEARLVAHGVCGGDGGVPGLEEA